MNTIDLTLQTYPVDPVGQQQLIALWRSEWARTDYDWLEALNGDYAETLTTTSVVAHLDGTAAATATVTFAKRSPETCLIGNVVTLAAFRGRNLAQAVVHAAVELGFDAGCNRAFLGSSRTIGNVYERCGFSRLAGSIMRRDAPGHVENGEEFVSGQTVEIRNTVWGDMPGFVHLLTQPFADAVIDYPRGLLTIAIADPLRCMSAFPVVHDDVTRNGGIMLVLAARNSPRVFGLGTLTPGPASCGAHRAVIDAAMHANFAVHIEDMMDRLLAEASARQIDLLEARVAVGDLNRLTALSRAGFKVVAPLPGHLRLRDRFADAVQLEARLR